MDDYRHGNLRFLGEQLRQLREDHDQRLSQTQVAAVAGVSRAAYSRWERGEAPLPDPAEVARLDDFYTAHGRLVAILEFVLTEHRTIPVARTWAGPVKPPNYTGEMHLLLRTPPGAPVIPALTVTVDIDGDWRLRRELGPIDETGTALAGAERSPVGRTIDVVTTAPVLISLNPGYPIALGHERVYAVRQVDWTTLPPRSPADP